MSRPLGRDLLLLCLLLAIVPGGRAHAGGFTNFGPSARGTGMGGALMGSIGDPTSFLLNPASLAYLSGTNFSFGATVMIPEQTFAGVAPATAETKMQALVIFPPNIYVTHAFSGGWGLGLAVDIPYVAKTEWNPDWTGGRLATKSDMRVVIITPSFGIKVSDRLSVGIGINLILPKVLYEQRIPVTMPGSQTPLSVPDAYSTYEAGGGINLGVQAGVLFKPFSNLSLGASYRSHVGVDLESGQLTYRGVPDSMTSQYPAGNFSTTFAIPAQLMAGASWQPLSWFTAAADIEYSTWSQFKSLDISYSNPSRPAVTVQQLWKNTVNTKFGVEFDFGEIIVRGGIRRQKTPIPTQTLTPGMPDADATGYSVGFGYRVADGLLLDFAYLLIHYADRVVTDSSIPYNNGGDGFNGTYTAQTNAIALNVRYSWN